jgi:hypothetical protein
VLRVLARLALGRVEPGAQLRDVIHGPLELHQDGVRAGVGPDADLSPDAGGRREPGRAVTLMELPCEGRADEGTAGEAGAEDAERALDGRT